MKKLIDVYVYRVRAGVPEFLLLKRASDKIYAHQWRMIGGKVKDGERYHEAAYREFREETDMQAKKYWVVPSVNTFYEARTDMIHHIPAFAMEVEAADEPRLDSEHVDHRWVSIGQLDEHLAWPEQKRLIELVYQIVSNDQILPEWTLETDSY